MDSNKPDRVITVGLKLGFLLFDTTHKFNNYA